ncbi:MAG: type II restriction endonuclease [Ignavibacteriaceae bacterium]
MSTNLSKYFKGIGAKRLSEVEIKPDISNQHEFNGINEFREIFGDEKIKFNGKFILLSDDEEKTIEQDGTLTWYDARERHLTRTEYRLYYSSNEIIENSFVGDLVIIARTGENKLLIIVAQAGTTSEKQLLWLFGLAEVQNKFIVKDLSDEKQELGYAGEYVINSLGIEIEEEAPDYLEQMLNLYGESFPSTSIFSAFARSTIKNISPLEEPDNTLLFWMKREELLFKTLERHIVQKKLNIGFGKDGKDVEDFINFSLSVQNRRKSRAGHAFENHLSVIFNSHKVRYSSGKVTELNKKPDFIFPGIEEYHNKNFDVSLLTLLGLKTTAKDRWRQVLSESSKIKNKHLITLEPAISKNQTDEMISENLQLVLPKEIYKTYSKEQQSYIIPLVDFIEVVRKKQSI